MKKGIILVSLCAYCGWEREQICVHPSRGPVRRIALERVERAQEKIRSLLGRAIGRVDRMSLDSSFDSGLPACRRRRIRRIRATTPRELLGKTIAFGPGERLPQGDIRVATSVENFTKLDADALAHPEIIRRLGVRCTPTRVRVESENALELVENP